METKIKFFLLVASPCVYLFNFFFPRLLAIMGFLYFSLLKFNKLFLFYFLFMFLVSDQICLGLEIKLHELRKLIGKKLSFLIRK